MATQCHGSQGVALKAGQIGRVEVKHVSRIYLWCFFRASDSASLALTETGLSLASKGGSLLSNELRKLEASWARFACPFLLSGVSAVSGAPISSVILLPCLCNNHGWSHGVMIWQQSTPFFQELSAEKSDMGMQTPRAELCLATSVVQKAY